MKNKDKSINRILVEICEYLEENNIDVIDFWEEDMCSIGFAKNHRLIYICTYNEKNQIFFEIEEHHAELNDTNYQVLSKGYLTNIVELKLIMDKYLD